MALVLTRRTGEDIRFRFDENMTLAELEQLLQDGITIRVVAVNSTNSQVRLGFSAPDSVSILRAELLEHSPA